MFALALLSIGKLKETIIIESSFKSFAVNISELCMVFYIAACVDTGI